MRPWVMPRMHHDPNEFGVIESLQVERNRGFPWLQRFQQLLVTLAQ